MNLDTQAQFEELYFDTTSEAPFVVYFTASWCAPCRRLDLPAIILAAQGKGLTFYKCDGAVNEYTPGYCGVRAFPTFILFKPKQVVSQIKSSDTDAVLAWIKGV
jgi:thioredoxin 1